MSAISPPLSSNILGAFAHAHGFSHGLALSWIAAAGLLEKLEIQRHLDMGDRESYLGRHPQFGTIAIMMSAISQCYVMSYEDLSAQLRSHLSVV